MLVPTDFVGKTEQQVIAPVPAEPGPVTEDLEVTRTSSLFREPRVIPSGFELVTARSTLGAAPVNISIELVYASRTTGSQIVVRRERVFALPLEASYDPHSAFLELRPLTLADGRAAVVYDWRSPDEQIARGIAAADVIPQDNAFRAAIVFDDAEDVVTIVEANAARDVSTTDLLKILESY